MDQELLDTSRYRITNLSVDSRFADRRFADSADYQIRLPSATKNIMRVALASVEIPNVEWVFSSAHGNLTYDISTDGGATWITITALQAGNYATAADLVAAVAASLAPHGITLTLDPVAQSSVITIPLDMSIRWTSTVSAVAARATHWGLGYYLGFRQRIISEAGTTVSEAPVLVRANPYYLLQLSTPDPLESLQHRLPEGAYVGAFAKILLRNDAYTTEFDDGGNLLRKDYTFLSPTNITNLRIRVLDPFGDVVDLRGTEWSLTLELYEVTSSRVHSKLMETYARK